MTTPEPRQTMSAPTRGGLRVPHSITLALRVTTCIKCEGRPAVLAAVISGLDRHLDPLPLSATGLAQAVTTGRWIGVANPTGPPVAHRAKAGHWWLQGYAPGYRPLLLAEHHHNTPALDHDDALAAAFLPRFINPPPPTTLPDQPPF